MNANVYLLGTSRSKCFPAFFARKLTPRYAGMTMPVIHQTATVRKIFAANIASYNFISKKNPAVKTPRLNVRCFIKLYLCESMCRLSRALL